MKNKLKTFGAKRGKHHHGKIQSSWSSEEFLKEDRKSITSKVKTDILNYIKNLEFEFVRRYHK